MKNNIDIQINCQQDIPTEFEIKRWIIETLKEINQHGQICIRIVEPKEIQELNLKFRNIDKTTNVLAFPFEIPLGVSLEQKILGDIVACAEIIQKQAVEQHKKLNAHWAHIIIHGTLHLLGYDHMIKSDAIIMEQLEIKILKKFDFSNPYEEV